MAERLIAVQLENRTFDYIIQRYDHETSVIYFDPPYVSETRAQSDTYKIEFSEQQHIEAASLLRSCAGYVIVSGYACPLYTELYEAHGWTRRDKEAQTNSGGKRIESLWLSPRTVEALNMPQQGSFL
jgi:DNA adenine methylase